ncbi:MAG: tyrosine-protein phosphatase [Clostridiales bacterium]|nr:tyrosine-protein phosphatase [Clostridiales bacterium]
MGSIQLKGVNNVRDLGGIMTRDGKVVKEKKLIRSGCLNQATVEDLRTLTEDLKVEVIIDLRTRQERKAHPDPQIKGVSNIWNPVFMEDIQGVNIFTQEERDVLERHMKALFVVSHRKEEYTEKAIQEVRDMFQADDFDPEAYMARMYHKFINNQIIQKQIRQFFTMLAKRHEGAVLWHCSEGKDRSGICTALLLYALGVSREDIVDNYVRSAESSEDAVDYLLEKLFPGSVPGNLEYQAIARRIFGVKTCYIEAFFDAIEKDYVSIDNYLQKAVELHVDNLVRLKTLYLE